MIIKDGFNKKDSDPLADYSNIGKGSHSLERDLEREKQGYIKANIENKVLADLRGDYRDDDNDSGSEDKWKFFR